MSESEDLHIEASLNTQREKIEAAHSAGDPASEADLRQDLSVALVFLERFDEARGELVRASEIHKSMGNGKAEAEARYALAVVLARSGNRLDEVRHNLLMTIERARGVGDKALVGKAYSALAANALSRKDIPEADRCIRLSADAWAEAADVENVIEALRFRTFVLQLMGRPEDAQKILARALEIAQRNRLEDSILNIRLDIQNVRANPAMDPGFQDDAADGLIRDAHAVGATGLAGYAALTEVTNLVRAGDLVLGMRYAQDARVASLEARDPILYTLACLGIAEIEDKRGNRLGVLNVLFTCQASLGDLLGSEARIPVLTVIDSVRTKWGEDAFQREMSRYRAQFQDA